MKNLVLSTALLVAGSLMGNAQMVGNTMNINKTDNTTASYNFNKISGISYSEDGSQMLLTPKGEDAIAYNVTDIKNITFEDVNLLLNPGFEDGGAHWTGKTNVNYDNKITNPVVAGHVISDNVTMRFSSKNTAAYLDQTVNVEKGKTYVFGFTGRIQDAPGAEGSALTGNRAISIQIRKKVDGKWTSIASEKVTVNTNTKVGGEVTIDDECPEGLNILITKATGIAYADDVYFIEKKAE